MNRRRIADFPAGAPRQLFETLNSKVLRIVFRHEELKLCFHKLRSQIGTGLREAEDVFSALSVQLVKLVGLKTAEMAEERRFTTISTSSDSPQSQAEDYMNKAIKASNELMGRQKLQVIQLITILKNIESQVNSSQKSMFEDLSSHQVFIRKLFMKASSYVSSGSRQNNDQCLMMLKILNVTFDQVQAALGSVEAGLKDMISELAKKMCNPMVEYVHGLRVELQAGACSSLLELMGKMHEEMKVKELELEKARRNQVEFAQEMRVAMKEKELELERARNQSQLLELVKIEALSRLEKSEERAERLERALRLLTEKTTSQQDQVKGLELEVTRNQMRLATQRSGSEALSRLKNSQETSPTTEQQEEVRILEEARNWRRSARQSRIDALSRLKKFEGTAKKQQEERTSTLREGQETKDDSLMWELLSMQKRKSPSGSDELQSKGTSSKQPPSKRVALPSHSHRPITLLQFKRADLQSTSIDSKRILRSSPSATTQRVLCGKRITP